MKILLTVLGLMMALVGCDTDVGVEFDCHSVICIEPNKVQFLSDTGENNFISCYWEDAKYAEFERVDLQITFQRIDSCWERIETMLNGIPEEDFIRDLCENDTQSSLRLCDDTD